MQKKRHLLATRLLMSLLALLLTATTAWADDVTYLEYNTETKAFDTKTCTSCTTVTDQTVWTEGCMAPSSSMVVLFLPTMEPQIPMVNAQPLLVAEHT